MSRLGFEPRTLGLKVRCKAPVEAFIKDRIMSGLSPRTIDFYEQKLSKLPQDISVLELTKEDIQKLLFSLSCQQGGKQAHLRAFKAFFSWAEENKLINANPCRKLTLKAPKPLRYAVPIEDIKTFLEACTSVRDKLVVALLADTGLWLSELASIQTEDIDFGKRVIKIWGKGAVKRRGRRLIDQMDIPLSPCIMRCRRSGPAGIRTLDTRIKSPMLWPS